VGSDQARKKAQKVENIDEEALLGAKRASSQSVRCSFDDRERSFSGRFVKGVFWQRLSSSPFG
jgi:hypothetical protein